MSQLTHCLVELMNNLSPLNSTLNPEPMTMHSYLATLCLVSGLFFLAITCSSYLQNHQPPFILLTAESHVAWYQDVKIVEIGDIWSIVIVFLLLFSTSDNALASSYYLFEEGLSSASQRMVGYNNHGLLSEEALQMSALSHVANTSLQACWCC